MSPTTTDPDAPHLLPSTFVALRFNGAMLVPRNTYLERRLGRVELHLLHQLVQVAPRSTDPAGAAATAAGADRAEADAALDDLRERGALVTGPLEGLRRLQGGERAPVVAVDVPQPDELLVVATPTVLLPAPEGYLALDLEGRVEAELSPDEVLAVTALGKATTLDHARGSEPVVASGLTPDAFDALVQRLMGTGIVRRASVGPDANAANEERSRQLMRAAIAHKMRLRKAVDRELHALDEQEAAITSETGVERRPVIPVHSHGQYLPLGLGMILAAIKAHPDESIARHFQIRPDWIAGERTVEDLVGRPGVFLFSNYLWSHSKNLERSSAIKAASPASITIHGGPDTPKYETDVASYLEANPHVDIAVHGEGEGAVAEILAALAGRLDAEAPPDLSPLVDVPGISFRLDGKVVRTADRDRLEDLNVIPSPYLTGVFDAYRGVPNLNVVIETNRGCPYGCTFCDWGTVTMARIRKYDLDRVMGELEWCATAGAQSIALADANFGIFERDVDIAARVVELKQEHGAPLACSGSYAKNTVKHLEQIIGMWVDAGMLTLGVLSLQTMDPGTLDAVRRSNIKTEKYDQLARQFRRRKLPLYVDLMMGLPGATVASFLDDLQSCIDREVQAKIHETVLLPNSPMNDPAYRTEHGIQIRSKGAPGTPERDGVVVATATMSQDDFEVVQRLKPIYLFGENFGVLRNVARYLRHETGTREVDLYVEIMTRADREPQRWPALDFVASTVKSFMAPPVSWSKLLDEVHELLVDHFGVPDDDALRAVLDVQQAVLPALGRPEVIALSLPHDVATWHEQMIDAKLDGLDWPTVVPNLRDLPPAEFVATDPLQLSEQILGVALGGAWLDSWELVSPVARPSVLGSGEARTGDPEPVPAPA